MEVCEQQPCVHCMVCVFFISVFSSGSVCRSGVSWTLLHEMDYLKYVSVRRDYIVLPEGALTNATRLRWWQPFTISSGLATPSLERAQWALDNILVGGSDINPSTLLDTFDDGELVCVDLISVLPLSRFDSPSPLVVSWPPPPEGVSHEESWSFYPNAVRTAGFCGNPSFHLYWPNKNQDRTHNILATRELIVQPGYILQFKVQYLKRAAKLLKHRGVAHLPFVCR